MLRWRSKNLKNLLFLFLPNSLFSRSGWAGAMLLLVALPVLAVWNSPYPQTTSKTGELDNVLYSSFSGRPKHLDPARAYSSDEYAIIAQIYEPPLQYHYLKRPYELVPLTAAQLPTVTYLDAQNNRLDPKIAEKNPEKIAFSVYEIQIQSGLKYQLHPAFVAENFGKTNVENLDDFFQHGTRTVTAADFIYQIKRLAHPSNHSPIFGVMAEKIVGLRELREQIKSKKSENWFDLRGLPLKGAEIVDTTTFRITIKGKYPQFKYWLAMPFFAPMAWEVERFYAQPALQEKNLTLDWYPVGTGPFMLTVNNPNQKMILEKNPNFRLEKYPSEGMPEDVKNSLLNDAGKPLPLLDRVEFSLEKESIPLWNKFLQGYYDASGVSSDSFDQAVQFSAGGNAELTADMKAKGIRLKTAVAPTNYYMGFNMRDPVVGGDSAQTRKLRQAISIAFDWEEYISIFRNGRGIAAQGPIPPGIFGGREGKAGINPIVYDWNAQRGKPQRKSIEAAKKLLAEAGYPDGRDAKTGKPLTLHFDTTSGGAGDKAVMDWYRKQFAKLNIQLAIRSTDYNRFRDKVKNGTTQIFFWGWNADYPDPENFLFLLHGPNAKVKEGGENTANYENPEFDALFDQMKNMEDSPKRQQIIDRMVAILREDAPWIWGFHPKEFGLYHAWYKNTKPNLMANNTRKYVRIDAQQRVEMQAQWNRPVLWPLWGGLVLFVLIVFPALFHYWLKERASLRKRVYKHTRPDI